MVGRKGARKRYKRRLEIQAYTKCFDLEEVFYGIIAIGHDGKSYPASTFVQDDAYALGDVCTSLAFAEEVCARKNAQIDSSKYREYKVKPVKRKHLIMYYQDNIDWWSNYQE